MGLPQKGWFRREDPNLKWMMTRGTAICGNLQMPKPTPVGTIRNVYPKPSINNLIVSVHEGCGGNVRVTLVLKTANLRSEFHIIIRACRVPAKPKIIIKVRRIQY